MEALWTISQLLIRIIIYFLNFAQKIFVIYSNKLLFLLLKVDTKENEKRNI